MSSTIDSRIVTMKFDNAQFAKAAADTLSTLAKISSATTGLTLVKAGQGLVSSLNRADLTPLSTQVEGVSSRFIALGTVAVTTLANITNRAVDAGISLANSLTLAPIRAGFEEYTTNLNSIQTILANTAASGSKLKDVNAALDELNEFSDKTIYNFSEMAKNIGTFTAAGVDLETATGAIKGIANLAALSGSNSQQASNAMYQLSQAISAGRVSLMDWNSVVNAGMGGAVFQRALADTAVAMGAINSDAVELQGEMKKVVINGQSFRDSISAQNGQPSWLTGEVLTNTLKQFTGDLNDAQLAAMGFSDAQILAIQEQAETAVNAATKVKDLGQLIDVARETAQSGWAQTWRYIFGDFREARRSFTAASNTVNDLINSVSDARNKILKDWKVLGGRTALLDSIVNIFTAIKNVVKPVGEAFRDIFPPITGQRLFDITEAFERFTEGLIAGEDTMDNIRTIFKAIFSIMKIGLDIVSGLVRSLFSLFGIVAGGTGGILDLVAAVADVVFQLTNWINQGEFISKFFDSAIKGREALFRPIVEAISDILTGLAGIVSSGAGAAFSGIVSGAKLLKPVGARIRDIFEAIGDVVENRIRVGLEKARPIVEDIRDFVLDISNNLDSAGTTVRNLFDFGDLPPFSEIRDSLLTIIPSVESAEGGFSRFLDTMIAIGTAIGAVLVAPFYLVAQLFDRAGDSSGAFGDRVAAVWEGVKSVFSAIRSYLSKLIPDLSFADVVRAINTGLIAALYASFTRFIFNMGGAVKGLKDVFGSAEGVLNQVTSNLKTMQNEVRANTLLKIAGAVALLTASIFVLTRIDPKKVGIALAAIAAMLTGLTLGMRQLQKGTARTALTSTANVALLASAMVVMAGAIVVLSGAIAILGNLDADTLKKGLASVIGLLTVFTGMAVVLGASKIGLAAGVGMVLIATALTVMSAALLAFAGAIKLYAKVDFATVAEGMAKIAFAMVILAAGATAMTAGAVGAATLIALAVALTVLIPQIIIMEKLGWAKVLKGAGILAAALGIIAFGALLLTPAIPSLFALAGAIALLGAGLLGVGVGMALFGAGLATLVALGGTALVVFTTYIQAILQLLPDIFKQLGVALGAFADAIYDATPKMQKAATRLLIAFYQTIVDTQPAARKAMFALLDTLLSLVKTYVPKFALAGVDILISFIKGIGSRAGQIAKAGVDLLVNLLDALGSRAEKIAKAGAEFLLDVLGAIEEATREYADDIATAGFDIAIALVDGLTGGLLGRGKELLDSAIQELVERIPGPIRKFLGIESPSKVTREIGEYVTLGLAQGITAKSSDVDRSAVAVGKTALGALQRTMTGVGAAFQKADVEFVPTITPVLDLTKVQKDAGRIGSMLDLTAFNPEVSFSRASVLSRQNDELRAARFNDDEPVERVQINFEQTNNSPKPISAIDSYRGTKNLLSLAKEALANS